MNNDLETQLRTVSKDVRLSSIEKERMRGALSEYMTPQTVRDTVSKRPVKERSLGTIDWWFFIIKRKAMPIVLIIALILGGGTAYAASDTIPGDILYPVKIKVNEPVKVAFTFSTQAKAQAHADIAEERLEEAERLLAKGELTQEEQEMLAADFSKRVVEVEYGIETFKENEPDKAIALGAQFTASLRAHEAILAHLGGDKDDGKTTIGSAVSNTVNKLALIAIRLDDDEGEGAETATMSLNVSSQTQEDTQESKKDAEKIVGLENAAAQLEAHAQKRLAEVEKVFAQRKGDVSATTTTAIEAELKKVQGSIDAGNVAVTAKDYKTAFVSFKQAFQIATRLHVFFSVSAHIDDPNLLGALLGSTQVHAEIEEEDEDGSGDDGDHASTTVSGTQKIKVEIEDNGDDDNTSGLEIKTKTEVKTETNDDGSIETEIHLEEEQEKDRSHGSFEIHLDL